MIAVATSSRFSLEELRVVEVGGLGEVVVGLRVALQQVDRGVQALGVLEQERLDRVEVGGLRGGGRRGRRGVGGIVVAAAAGEGDAGEDEQHQKTGMTPLASD